MKTFTAHLNGQQIGTYKASDKMTEEAMKNMLVSRYGVSRHVEVYERYGKPLNEQEDAVGVFFQQLDYLDGVLGSVIESAEGVDVPADLKMGLLELRDFYPQFQKLANMLKARFDYQEEVQKAREEEE